MTISEILYVVTLIFSVLVSIVTTLLVKKETKKSSNRQGSENGTISIDGNSEITEVDKSATFWNDLLSALPSYIVSAEQFYNQIVGKSAGVKTGAQKLAQVLDKIKIDCLTAGVDYDEEKATDMVNNLIDLTNQVNTHK